MPSSKPRPGHSFAEVHPELVDEWDFTANQEQGWSPETTTARSSRRVWWICRTCSHRWIATPNNRSRGNGCQKCGVERRRKVRQKPPSEKSLATLYPRAAQDWHPTKNKPDTPKDVYAKSEVPRWWRCQQGHEEFTPPKRRVKGVGDGGCTVCGGRTVLAGFNDLATTYPHIAELWDTERNDALGIKVTEVSAGSMRNVWWTCSAGHSTQQTVKTRVRSAGCSRCHILGRSRIEIELGCELAAVGVPVQETPDSRWTIGDARVQLDIVVPSWKLIIEFDGWHWHKGRKKAADDLAKTMQLQGQGWTVIRLRDRLDALTSHDVVVDFYDGALVVTKELLLQIRGEGYCVPRIDEYLASESPWAEYEANRKLHVEREKSLLSEFPDLAAEFDYELNNGLRPEALHPGTNRRVFWHCSVCDHQWETAVNARTTGRRTGCPSCKGRNHAQRRRTPKPGQSLAEQYPHLAAEWDYRKNPAAPDSYRPFSFDEAWWLCPDKNHSYKSVIASRSHAGNGCPICDGKQVLAGETDLATTPNFLPCGTTRKTPKSSVSIRTRLRLGQIKKPTGTARTAEPNAC